MPRIRSITTEQPRPIAETLDEVLTVSCRLRRNKMSAELRDRIWQAECDYLKENESWLSLWTVAALYEDLTGSRITSQQVRTMVSGGEGTVNHRLAAVKVGHYWYTSLDAMVLFLARKGPGLVAKSLEFDRQLRLTRDSR